MIYHDDFLKFYSENLLLNFGRLILPESKKGNRFRAGIKPVMELFFDFLLQFFTFEVVD